MTLRIWRLIKILSFHLWILPQNHSLLKANSEDWTDSADWRAGPEIMKRFSVLNSAEHEVFSANKYENASAEHEIFSANKYKNANCC